MQQDRLIELGTIGKIHGIKGGLSLLLYNSKSQALKKGQTIILKPRSKESKLPAEGRPFELVNVLFGPKKCIVYLKGINSATEVEELLPCSLFLSRSQFPIMDGKNRYYVVDLMGLSVIDHQDPQKKIIGTVTNFYQNVDQVVLFIELLERKNIELPFVDVFFPEVDLEKGRISIVIPDYIEARDSED